MNKQDKIEKANATYRKMITKAEAVCKKAKRKAEAVWTKTIAEIEKEE